MEMEEPVQGVEPSLQLEPAEVDPGTLHLTPDPPAWPGHGWQAPEPQPVNTGLSGGDSSREMAAQLQNTLLAATIGVTIFFALVLVVILAKLYQTFESPLAPASTVESQLSYLTSSVGSGQHQERKHPGNGLVENRGHVLDGGGSYVTSMADIGGVSSILEEERLVSAIGVEEDEDGGIETKY